MFQLVFFILFTSGFTESQGKKVLCSSSDVEISYSFCDSMDHVFFLSIVPCSFSKSRWKATLLLIPRSDIIFLEVSVNVWYDDANVLERKEVICSGFDDDYSFCGTLKGETLNTTFEFSGLKMKLPKGIYTIFLRLFSGPSEKNLQLCTNVTLLIK
ncbi:E3 ubiquitin-protein ligase RNF216 [Platysternon megacephalum]|uniref:E3 ubiquitin-protein ligase RNF216 n=1 Tax=Platysternon megacephalum TaxID=55544 RepID=A0A4D9EY50_9SAUR|nr:E3 ubiquitin-protein ligase RNF216 [Platysternon megacephalum]